MQPVTALIVEDERLASHALEQLLAARDTVRCLGVARDGNTAVQSIRNLRPDILFLDIELPALDGFEVIERVGVENMPLTIFVTAYDQYTLRAFEVHAVDYLLKPFGEERFEAALSHALLQLRMARKAHAAALTGMIQGPRRDGRLAVKAGGRTIFVELDKVDYFEAFGNYVRIHSGSSELLTRETMSSLEDRLRPYNFVRIHRSVIVNRRRVHELRPWYTGEYVVLLTTGKELTLSRGFRDRLPLLSKPL
ncbi:MAG TPA: LytTR family DNA-binding domain-containing protein [Bryobacteraceae bacterium]|nr:LytTR family DNA-binding domain-containing protein [Bryobacteraceae bacterium]